MIIKYKGDLTCASMYKTALICLQAITIFMVSLRTHLQVSIFEFWKNHFWAENK